MDEKNYQKNGLFLGLIFISIILLNPLIGPFHAEATHEQSEVIPEESPQSHPCLILGDILFMDWGENVDFIINWNGITSNDHCALFVGTKPNESGNQWFIEADPSGVHYSTLLDFEDVCTNLLIARVKNTNQDQRQAAVNWTRLRIGADYQFWAFEDGTYCLKCANPDAPLRTANLWYCSELVWAAWYHQGIDIDYNGWRPRPWILPSVNMGVPQKYFWWMAEFLPFNFYAYQNEIQLDDDIQLIPWS